MSIKKVIGLAFSVGILGGCTVGQSEFNCSAGDDNALCGSSRTIYRATDGELKENTNLTYIKDGKVHQTSLAELDSLKNPNSALSQKSKISEISNPSSQLNQGVPFSFSYDGQVLRKDVQVLRIWIAPWVDKSDDLHLSTLVYTDIENRKWEVGTVHETTTSQPTKVVKRLSQSSDANVKTEDKKTSRSSTGQLTGVTK